MFLREDLDQKGKCEIKETSARASLVAQWLRIRLPMQETRVRSLAREDPTCHGATKPVCATTTEPALYSLCATTMEAHEPKAHALQQETPRQ